MRGRSFELTVGSAAPPHHHAVKLERSKGSHARKIIRRQSVRDHARSLKLENRIHHLRSHCFGDAPSPRLLPTCPSNLINQASSRAVNSFALDWLQQLEPWLPGAAPRLARRNRNQS